ncbi:hypothetical protein M3Y98_00870200 [Aphelenchoides besseyi]|nr:hypothetical protein M3Y98_00870200 [Aphelenchoides besseyi]
MSSEVLGTTNINCPQTGSQIYYAIVSGTSILLNTVLILLVKSQTPDQLRPYSEVLLMSVIIDLLSSILQFLTQARPILLGEKHILTFNLDGWLPRLVQNWSLFNGGNLNYIMIPEYIACYFSVCFCCVPFLFRYFMVCWSRRMKRWELVLMIYVLFGFVTISSVSVNYAAAKIYDENIQLLPKANSSCLRFLPQFSERENSYHVDLLGVYRVFYYSLLLIVSTYLLNGFCALKIHLFLRKQVHMSRVLQRLQSQVSWTLAIQAVSTEFLMINQPFQITPLLAFYGPNIASMILSELHVNNTFVFELIFIFYSLVPLLNSIAAISLMESYRKAFLLNTFGCLAKVLKKSM